jgi:proteasome assembly chaperone (PAC2) family protein
MESCGCKSNPMSEEAIKIDSLPKVTEPVLIAGFEGWGNALDMSHGMVSYLIRTLKAKFFAKIDSDLFYRYDDSRPFVNIEGGFMKSLSPPGGAFYGVRNFPQGRDLIILRASEPNLRWHAFVQEMLSLSIRLGVKMVISLGGMYDKVLHSDTIISATASDEELLSALTAKNLIPISYQGPSAIHSLIHLEAQKMGFQSISLWCHCPYYLQGTTHFGLMSELGGLLSSLGGFALKTDELQATWRELNRQIEALIEKNPELQSMIAQLREEKVRGSWANIKEAARREDKVIHIEDFLKPK